MHSIDRSAPSGLRSKLLDGLRDAARIGIADAEAGRFRSFSSPTALKNHLLSLAREAIREKGWERGG